MSLCPVCLLALDEEEGVAIVQTACKHRFHLGCLLKCLEHRSAKCPMCRQCVDIELAAAPRPWMATGRKTEVQPRRSVLMGPATTEAAVAVEIAESVRRSLLEDDSRRAAAMLSPEASGFVTLEPAPDGLTANSTAVADEPRRLPVPEAAADYRRSGYGAGRLSISRTSWSISDELAWYGEIAEAVAVSLADEAQHLQGPVGEAIESREVDPDALAGLRETVLHIHDTNMFSTRPMTRLPERHLRRSGCGHAASPSHNLDLNFSDTDIASIAREVLRSLDEESAVSRA